MGSEINTRHTLIQRAQAGDLQTWDEFAHYYKAFIYYVLNRMNVDYAVIDDIAQEILITLWKNLPSYSRQKGKFRTWLGTVIRNTSYTELKKASRLKSVHDAAAKSLAILDSFSEPELNSIIDEEWKIYLSNITLERMRDLFTESAVESFILSSQGISADDIAQKLGISKHTVYSNTKRIKQGMIEEAKSLINELEF